MAPLVKMAGCWLYLGYLNLDFTSYIWLKKLSVKVHLVFGLLSFQSSGRSGTTTHNLKTPLLAFISRCEQIKNHAKGKKQRTKISYLSLGVNRLEMARILPCNRSQSHSFDLGFVRDHALRIMAEKSAISPNTGIDSKWSYAPLINLPKTGIFRCDFPYQPSCLSSRLPYWDRCSSDVFEHSW